MYRFYLPFLVFLVMTSSLVAGEFQFKHGDRVALVGSTLIEREQKYGYWELAITTRHPNKNIIFRNLGWSGDTVWGESRVGFDLDNPQKGFERLRDAVLAVKPTVIIVGYGTNESFAGEAGLPRFKEGLNKLLDAFAPTKARIVLLAPLAFETHERMIPDPTRPNHNISIYSQAIAETAKQRDCYFVDIFAAKSRKDAGCLTSDGMQLTEYGYRYSGELLMRYLCLDRPLRTIPNPDNKLTPEKEKLRQAIIEKNQLYFHRYRPQNETYLFGFRKYEQGNNAVEVPQFDALIEAKEKEIAKLLIHE